MFDPYETWLSIPKDRRPVNHYLLLGISPKEDDPNVIEKAAARRSDKLTPHEEGAQAALAAKIRKEIDKAKGVLLDPIRRKDYDGLLRKKAAVVEVEEVDEVEPGDEVDAEEEKSAAKDTKKSKGSKGKKKKKAESEGNKVLWLAAGGSAALVLLAGGVGAFIMSGSSKPKPQPKIEEVAKIEPKKVEPPVVVKEVPKKVELPPKAEVPPTPVPVVPTAPPPKPVPRPAPSVERKAIPTEAVQAAAEKALKNTFKADYAKATTPEEKLTFAAKLLQPGREDRKDPAAWFVLLREARDLALQAERPRLAVEAIHDMHTYFVVDGHDLKIKALTAVGQSTKEDTLKALVHVALAQIGPALDEDRYDAALQFASIAAAALEAFNKKAKQPDLKKKDAIAARKSEVEKYQKEYATVAEARQKLQSNPADPETNLIVGKHICFFQGDWQKGLPLLEKGIDAGLAALAKRDLALSPDYKEEIAVADGWAQRGKKEKDRRQRNLFRRAIYWYDLADERMPDGPERVALFKSIQEIAVREAGRPTRLTPGSFNGRTQENRALLLREGGGSVYSEEAVQRGLDWLAAHQNPIGGWSMSKFAVSGKCNCGDPGGDFDIGATSLALMAFLGAGETPGRGRFKDRQTVYRGLKLLRSLQKEKGNFSDQAYENAMATIVMCEGYALNRQAAYRESAQRAVLFIFDAQAPEGGWSYTPKAKGSDTSVSGWQFSALKAATHAGLVVPPIAFDRLASFLDGVADPGNLGYGYNTRGAGRATSAAGLLVREFMGWGPHHPYLSKGVQNLLVNLPTKEAPALYYTYYATQVMHHAGGRYWETWNSKVRDMLVDLQDKGDDLALAHQKGSWSPKGDEYAATGGRLMTTALAIMALEAPYYHVPLHDFGRAVLDE